MLNAIMLIAAMVNVVMLSVVMLNVVAPMVEHLNTDHAVVCSNLTTTRQQKKT